MQAEEDDVGVAMGRWGEVELVVVSWLEEDDVWVDRLVYEQEEEYLVPSLGCELGPVWEFGLQLVEPSLSKL